MTGKPVAVFRAGGIRAAIWENQIKKDGQDVTTHSVAISRSYKIGETWKEASSYSVNDLPRVALVAQKAFEHLALKDQEQRGPRA